MALDLDDTTTTIYFIYHDGVAANTNLKIVVLK